MTGTTGFGLGHMVKLGIVSLAVAVAGIAATPDLAAAASTGPWAPASVRCDAWLNTLEVTPSAGAMSGYDSQQVWYRYWIWDATRGGYLWNGSSTAWNSFVHTARAQTNDYVNGSTGWMINPGPVAGPSLRVSDLADGTYYVYTQYAWSNGSWSYAGGWSNQFALPYMSGYGRADSCTI